MPLGWVPVVSGGSWLPPRRGTGPIHHEEVAIHRVGNKAVYVVIVEELAVRICILEGLHVTYGGFVEVPRSSPAQCVLFCMNFCICRPVASGVLSAHCRKLSSWMIPLAKVFGNIIALRVHKNRATGGAVVQGPVALFERTTLISNPPI